MVRRNLSAFVIGLVATVVLAGGAGPAVLAKTKVRFMMWGPPDPYEPVIAAFEKAHPDIDVVPEPGPDFGPYLTRLQAQFAAGLAHKHKRFPTDRRHFSLSRAYLRDG